LAHPSDMPGAPRRVRPPRGDGRRAEPGPAPGRRRARRRRPRAGAQQQPGGGVGRHSLGGLIGVISRALSEAAPEPDRIIAVKCLVWDLDDTLWQGTLLERDDVHVSSAVWDVVRGLDARGILQSVASRNEHGHAWARLEQLGLAQYFVLPHIGWGPKSDAVRSIADKLGFAHRTIGFIDDQPAERAEVTFRLPGVRCYTAAH